MHRCEGGCTIGGIPYKSSNRNQGGIESGCRLTRARGSEGLGREDLLLFWQSGEFVRAQNPPVRNRIRFLRNIRNLSRGKNGALVLNPQARLRAARSGKGSRARFMVACRPGGRCGFEQRHWRWRRHWHWHWRWHWLWLWQWRWHWLGQGLGYGDGLELGLSLAVKA
ncbi:MAG: hypothetical protein V2I27_02095 [Erythrobacter sp.]|nr:hypothetical protein [Erythrobacter sp.]